MPRKQTRKYRSRNQRKLDDIQLNMERMKLANLIHRCAGKYDTGSDIRRMMYVCRLLTQKVHENLEKL